jgi:flagellin-like protein
MMKKSWKNRSGVSPVIATILMVAITVVLAAVLYVMVMGFGGSGTPQAPAATLTKDGSLNRVIVNINPASTLSNFKASNNATAAVALTNGATIVTGVTFVDSGGDGKLTSGDYFQITGTAHGTLNLYWVNGDTTQALGSIAY